MAKIDQQIWSLSYASSLKRQLAAKVPRSGADKSLVVLNPLYVSMGYYCYYVIKNAYRSICSWIVILVSLAASSSAFGQLTVNRSVIEFSADNKIQDIEVLNTGEFKLYLDLKVSEIISPESLTPTRVELDDPRSASVLVSPRQLLVPPGQRKRVRIILREAATSVDRIYRLSVKPYTGKLKLDSEGGGKKASAIKVLVGYDLLLLSRPPSLQPKVDVKRTASSIEFTNRGNTNVLLRKIIQCEGVKLNCVDLQPNRLYAGETYKVDLPKPGTAAHYPVEVWAVGRFEQFTRNILNVLHGNRTVSECSLQSSASLHIVAEHPVPIRLLHPSLVR